MERRGRKGWTVMSHESRVTRIALMLIALVAMMSAGCNASMNDAYLRQLQDRDQKIEKLEKDGKKRDAELATLKARDGSIVEKTRLAIADAEREKQETQKADADANPSPLPGPGGTSDYQHAGEQALRPVLGLTRPPAINVNACRMRMTGPWVGYSQGSPLGDPYPMFVGDRTKHNGCAGACEALQNQTNKYYELRMSAMDPSRPGLAATAAAVTLCSGNGLLSAAMVQRDNGPPEMVTLLPPGVMIVIGPFGKGTAQLSLIEHTPMPRGYVWPSGNVRVEEVLTFPTSGWTGWLKPIQPRA
jgi:hypothetical protein